LKNIPLLMVKECHLNRNGDNKQPEIKKLMKILIAGAGKLANSILSADLQIQGCEIAKWKNENSTANERAIVVHAGSGRQLNECIEFCSRTQSVFIELSTGLKTENTETDFPLVICPNTSVLILKALIMLRKYGHNFDVYEKSIIESHQSSKATEPGTAYAFADSLHFNHAGIISVRDREVQLNQIEIPAEYLDKHAYHRIIIKDEEDEIAIETRVLGHKSYASGVKRIIEAVLKNKLENKKYNVLDLIEMELL